jgi:class 3 adenylate cyclase
MELGHVLFMDIVAYTQLPTDKQTKILRQFQDIVRMSPEVVRARETDSLISLPTGDGMALVFFGDPEVAVRSALEISRTLQGYPYIKLRMGVHSGPVNRIMDVNDKQNVAGAGINMAQRVMNCGDAGHILVSKRVADDLSQYTQWQPYLHGLGEVEVKHGERVHLFNLYTDELGNPKLPNCFKKRKKTGLFVPVLVAILLVAAVGIFLVQWRPWSRNGTNTNNGNASIGVPTSEAERVFTYFLTPSDKGKSVEEERFAGNEQFRSGSKFRLVLIPEQSGTLYLLNQGPGANGAEAWNVLFPTPKNNDGSSQIAANQRIEARIRFDMYPGTENLAIIWSTTSIPKLEKIFQDAAKTDFEIKNPAQVATVKEFFENHGSPEPKAEVDADKHQTTVRGKGEIFIHKRVLKHFKF